MTFYPEEVPRHLTYRRRTLNGILEETARRFPHTAAIRFFGATLTFAQLDREAGRFAAALAGIGVKPGDRVAIHLPNSPQFLICLNGALKAGAIATLVNPLYERREILYQIQDSGARVMVTLGQQHLFSRAAAAQRRAGFPHLIVTGIKDYFPGSRRFLFSLLREKKEGHRVRLDRGRGQVWMRQVMKAAAPMKPLTVDPGDTALLQYTGGTTGIPKAAELSHDNLVSNCAQSRAWLWNLADGKESAIMVLPLFHVYGLTCSNLMTSIACTQIMLPRFDLSQVLKTIARERPTVFPGIPAMYAAINHSLAREPDSRRRAILSSIKVCISGSDRLPPDVQREFESLSGGRLVEGYGLTEASPVTHVNPLNGPRKPDSIGLPLPDTEVRLVDPDSGAETPAGEVGEMLVRGPQVMKRYWRQPDETAATLSADGWLKTGDMARTDTDGFYYIADRKKDLIITGGINVYPRDVEAVLARFDKVREVAVKGVPHRLKGQVVKAYVVLKEGEQSTPGEIRRFARGRLADYKVPQQVEFLSELPRSSLRKVLKRKLDN